MAKGGKYLAKKAPKKKNKVLPIVLIVILVILAVVIGGVVWYYNHMLSMLTRPSDVTVPTVTEEIPTMETIPETTVPVETSPEDTWPRIVSDENITNIMLVGNAIREGETYLITDTMILVSINREQKTVTLTSLMRDLRLVWPKYVDTNGRSHTGHNRINMAYNMGYSWTKNKQDSMDLLETIVSQNFGVEVDRTIEIDFGVFMKICDLVGGVTVNFNEDEIKYMQDNYGDHEPNFTLVPGDNYLNGWQALCYARMRKVGHGDFERTERQREVITSLLKNVSQMGLMQIHGLFMEILPDITTDLTNKEITNLAWELIPMLKDLKIQSQRIPFDGTYWDVVVDIPGQGPDNQIDCNVAKNGELLRASIGMTAAAEE